MFKTSKNLLLKKNAVEVEDYVKSNLQKSRLSQETDICGPQISQIEIYNRLNKKNINISSTGEQKLLLISLILSHARMLNVRFNFPPILLLDDIVEHLDEKHRNALYKEVSKHCAQSFFTSTSLSAFEAYPHEIDKIHLPTVKNNFKSYYDFEMEKF